MCIATNPIPEKNTSSNAETTGIHSYDPALLGLKNKIVDLERSNAGKDSELRTAQASLLAASGQKDSIISTLDEKEIHHRFADLNRNISDYVLTHFKNAQPATRIPRDVLDSVGGICPKYSQLMQDSRSRFLLLRAVIAEYLVEQFQDFRILGDERFVGMDERVSRQGIYHSSLLI